MLFIYLLAILKCPDGFTKTLGTKAGTQKIESCPTY